MSFLQIFSLPLLTKELIEQAHNKRIYILRVLCALVLYSGALLQYSDISAGGTAAGLMNLGRGRGMFQLLWQIQVFMIFLLLPPITCGALTVEKEKDTLAILLLTKLSPWTIVFEKFLSRIFAMGTYQLLSLPLFAIIYGLGGVELWELIFTVAGLVALTLIVGSVSILCSTWFRTTSAAFAMTYVSLLGLSSCLFSQVFSVGMPLFMARNRTGQIPWIDFIINSVVLPVMVTMMALAPCMVCLYAASKVLVPRAFVPVRNLALELFRYADRFFNDLNKVTTGGIVLVPDRETLPAFDPIAWRETRKKSLGTFRYQFRVLMLLLTPLIFVIAYVMTDGRSDFSSPFRGFPPFFWTVSIICLTIHATGAMPAERTRQTLDVILVAPLTSFEIVRQKLAGVRRLIMILTVPFAILIGFQAIWSGYVLRGSTLWQNGDFLLELSAVSLAVLFYMPLIMWIGFQFGLRMKTQIQAVLSTFAAIGAVCVIPGLFLELFYTVFGGGPLFALNERLPDMQSALTFATVRWLNPVNVIFRTQDLAAVFRSSGTATSHLEWLVVAIHFTFFGFLWWRVRRNALRNFSRIVGRLEPSSVDEPMFESSGGQWNDETDGKQTR